MRYFVVCLRLLDRLPVRYIDKPSGSWLMVNNPSASCFKLDMSTARRRLKSSRSLSGTSAHPTMVTQVNILVMNEWLTSFCSLSIGRPVPEMKLFQTLTFETPKSRSWVWSKGKVIQSAQYHINSLPLHFTSIRPTIPGYFEIWPWNIQGQCHEWGQWSRSHTLPSIQPMLFLFVSHQSDQ